MAESTAPKKSAKFEKLVFVKSRVGAKIEVDPKTKRKFITEKQSYGYSPGRTHLITDKKIYDEMVNKWDIAVDYDPKKHPEPKV